MRARLSQGPAHFLSFCYVHTETEGVTYCPGGFHFLFCFDTAAAPSWGARGEDARVSRTMTKALQKKSEGCPSDTTGPDRPVGLGAAESLSGAAAQQGRGGRGDGTGDSEALKLNV